MEQSVFAELGQKIAASRSAGVVHVFLKQTAPPPADNLGPWIDAVLAGTGLKPLSDGWCEIAPPDAIRVLRNILPYDLAYRAEIMPSELAAELADRFCAPVPAAIRYLTNGTWRAGPSDDLEAPSSWCPITDATFDAGIVAVGESYLAVVWVEDED
jgi:hypothetical protein